MNFETLQKEAHAIAREKGDYDTERSFSSFIEAVHEALSEAGKAYRKHGFDSGIVAPQASVTPNGIVADGQLIPDSIPVYLGNVPRPKPFGVPSELANVAIHLADMAQFYGVQNVEAHMDNTRGANRIFERLGDQSLSFERAVATAHWGTAQIFEVHLLYPNYCWNPSPWHGKLGWLLQFIQETAVIHSIDLRAAVAARIEYLRR